MQSGIKKEIEKIRQEIRRHDHLYYVLSHPEISDKEYDDLMKRLKALEDKYPGLKSPDSPTVRLSGGVAPAFKTVRHRQKMLSLDNTYSFEELKDWGERVLKGLGNSAKVEYVAELKIDGVSANITYDSAKLVIGSTRGDGESGEDITGNIKTIRAIPLVLMGEDTPEFIEIRGEVYMDKNEFNLLNKEREAHGLELFANPRNAASGSLKLLDTAQVAQRKLNFFAHSLGEYSGTDIRSHWEYLQKLKGWGVRINPSASLCNNLGEVIDYCKIWQGKRDGLPYEIDGMAIKVNSIGQQKELGFTLRSPRWAVAYKFPARQATTQLLKININVGRTGVITPTAELKPVECSGVVIRHATLHNFDEIKRLNIKEGDRVLIERAGDVIPKVVKVVQSRGAKAFPIPKACPACSAKVIKEKEEDVAYRCINPSCPAQIERGLIHFGSRLAMDIQGLGEAAVRQMVAKGLVRDFADIYYLKKEAVLNLELFKDRKAQNLLDSIEKSKRQPLSRLIYGLGIRHVGEKAAYLLAREFKTLDALAAAKFSDFEAIYEIGPVMADSVVSFFKQEGTLRLMKKLKGAGLNLEEKVSRVKESALTGKNIVLTGELRSFTRLGAKQAIRQAGGNVLSTVSRNTDFVVAGDDPGSKYEKAKKIGVKIIGEKEFQEMLK